MPYLIVKDERIAGARGNLERATIGLFFFDEVFGNETAHLRDEPAVMRSGVQSACRYSGTIFSPKTRLARMTVSICASERNSISSHFGTR